MDDIKWFYIFLISIFIAFLLSSIIINRSDQVDKKMCTDAGMSWGHDENGNITCDVSNNN